MMRNMKKYLFLIIVLVLIAVVPVIIIRQKAGIMKNSTDSPQLSSPVTASPSAVPAVSETIPPKSTPAQEVFDASKKYTAVIHTTLGDITLVLTAKETPKTAENFVTLARKGFYNNTVFHRVIKGFMIQGGDPKGDGTGGPGYTFNDEPFTGEYTRGTIAMANAGPNTNGSQFFIMHRDYPLPKNYVIFGKTVSGLEVVDKIAEAPVTASRGEMSTPVTPVTVSGIDILEE